MRIVLAVTVLIALCVNGLKAQSYFNVVKLNSGISPSNHYKNHNGSLDIANYGIAVQAPVTIDTNNLFLFGFLGSKTEFKYSDNLDGSTRNRADVVGLQIGWQRTNKNGNKRLIMLIPSLKSDFNDVDAQHYQMGGLVLFTKTINEKLKVNYGLYVNTEFFGPFFSPLLGVDYKMNSNWRVFGTLPSYLTLEKIINNRLRTGLDARIGATTFRNGNSLSNAYLHQNLNTISGFIEVYPQKLVAIRIAAGHSVFRNYKEFDADEKYVFNVLGIGFGNKRIKQESIEYDKLKNGLVFELSVFLRFEIP